MKKDMNTLLRSEVVEGKKSRIAVITANILKNTKRTVEDAKETKREKA